MNSQVCYFSQMYQSIPSLVSVQKELGGTFICGRKSTYRYFKKHNPSLELARYRKRFNTFNDGHRRLMSARYILTGSPYQTLLAPYSARKMMVFHGTYAGVSPAAAKGLRHFDQLFLIGPRMEKILSKYREKYSLNYTKTGFIPFDNFPQKNKENKLHVLGTLGLDPSLKTIVYCPSRRNVGSWELCAEDLIHQASDQYNLILRPHPSQSMNLRWHEQIPMRRLKNLSRFKKNIILDFIDTPLPDLLMIADLLISDANSPAEEALFYDTPQLFTGLHRSAFDEAKNSLQNQDIPEEDIADILRIYNCGPSFAEEKFGNWKEAIESALINQQHYKNERTNCFSFIFGQKDQKAGKRVADIIRLQMNS